MLSRLLDIRPGEGRALGYAALFAFLCIGAQTIASIGSDTVFVSAFSLGELSRFYVVSSILRVVVSLGYGALASRAKTVRFDVAFLVLTGASIAGSGLCAGQSSKPVLYAVSVVLLLLPSILPLVAMGAALDAFDPRQAKRLLPLVAAAATVGAIALGGVANAAARRIGTPGLLVLGGVICLATLPFPSLLAALAPKAEERETPAGSAPAKGLVATLAGSFGDLRRVPVVRIFAITAFLGAAASYFVDFGFKAALKASFARDEMAAYLGTFNVVAEAAVLVAQLFLTSRLVRRLGVGATLQLRPLALFAMGPLFLVLSGVGVSTGAKLAETVLRLSVAGAVADLLLTPTPSSVRTRAKILAKSASTPLGSLAAGTVLGMFGLAGPSSFALGIILLVTGVLSVLALLGVGRAYTAALSQALGERRGSLDVSPQTAALLRSELTRRLAQSVAKGDAAAARDVLGVMDRSFTLDDIAPALAERGELAKDAIAAALRVARAGEGPRLLALVPPSDDDTSEREVLARVRELDAIPDRARIDRALARGQGEPTPEAAALWGEAVVALAKLERDPAVKLLRKATLGPDSPKRAAALHALGELRDRRAEPEVLRALGSADPVVFAEAARVAVLIDATGAVPTLVARLGTGSNVRATIRALALAGPRAVNELLAALPTTRGEGGIRTAVASDRTVAGTVRAARVLSRLGPEACRSVLERFGDLGYRARNSIARALATVPIRTGRALEPAAVGAAMELTLAYAETLTRASAHSTGALLHGEVHHRIGETADRMLDLASIIGDRELIARARAGLARTGRDRGNALELLENVLPKSLAARTVSLVELAGDGPKPSRDRDGPMPALDGWLDKCAKYDAGRLPVADPMRAVMDRLLVLRESSLFTALSGEELYPVGELAQPLKRSPGEIVVKQGDPGDALFVVASGTLRVVRDGKPLREMSRGAAFGEMALLDGGPRAATIEAVTEAELLRIPRPEFEALLDESPELARGVIRTLLGHLRGAG